MGKTGKGGKEFACAKWQCMQILIRDDKKGDRIMPSFENVTLAMTNRGSGADVSLKHRENG